MPDSVSRHARTRSAPKRTAITLIEVIGTLSVLLVLAVSATSILGAITDIGARNNRAKQGRVSVERFANAFRIDVHDAGNVMLTDNDWPVELTTPTRTIRYEWDERTRSIRRTANGGDVEKQLAVDRFQLFERCEPRISVTHEMATVVLMDGQQTQPWIIEAIRQ